MRNPDVAEYTAYGQIDPASGQQTTPSYMGEELEDFALQPDSPKIVDYFLFRIKVFEDLQRPLFQTSQPTKQELIVKAAKSLPSASFRQGTTWHIGNVELDNPDLLYFRIGRTARRTKPEFHGGRFEDVPSEDAPYTHVLVDLPLELVALQAAYDIARTPFVIAHELGRLLSTSTVAGDFGVSFHIDAVKDPEEFRHKGHRMRDELIPVRGDTR